MVKKNFNRKWAQNRELSSKQQLIINVKSGKNIAEVFFGWSVKEKQFENAVFAYQLENWFL